MEVDEIKLGKRNANEPTESRGHLSSWGFKGVVKMVFWLTKSGVIMKDPVWVRENFISGSIVRTDGRRHIKEFVHICVLRNM